MHAGLPQWDSNHIRMACCFYRVESETGCGIWSGWPETQNQSAICML